MEYLKIQVIIKDLIKQDWYINRGLLKTGENLMYQVIIYFLSIKTNNYKGLYVTNDFKGCWKSDHYVTFNKRGLYITVCVEA